jgi:hypothetical protein
MSELAIKQELTRSIQQHGYEDALLLYHDLITPILQGRTVSASIW